MPEPNAFSIKKIGENIETLILTKMKKSELAKRMGVKPQTLQVFFKRINSNGNIEIRTIEKIAAAGGVTLQELLNQNQE